MLVGLHIVLKHEFEDLSIPMVQNLLTEFGRLVNEVCEVLGLDH